MVAEDLEDLEGGGAIPIDMIPGDVRAADVRSDDAIGEDVVPEDDAGEDERAAEVLWEEVAAQDVAASRCATFVDEWVRGGVRHAVICPGSRSTPMALALAAEHRLRVHIRLDERSAAFVALGIGLVSGRPAVLCTTSGTATAEVHAAVVEAHHGAVPLLVCTADRPIELHDVGAPQTIDQRALYGSALRWSIDTGVAELSCAGSWRSQASRALVETMEGASGPGPVHVNMAFREPLLGRPSVVPAGRAGGQPWHQQSETDVSTRAVAADLAALGLGAGCWVPGIVVVGAGCADPDPVLELAAWLGWPVLADPRSGCRQPGPAVVVAAADAIMRVDEAAELLAPRAVIRLGQPWASKVLATWLDRLGARGVPQIQVAAGRPWIDPGRSVVRVVGVGPHRWCAAALAQLQSSITSAGAGTEGDRPDPIYLRRWALAEEVAQDAIETWAAGQSVVSEPVVARTVMANVHAPDIVVLGSSMPVRDAEWFTAVRDHAPTVLANRGANGIDGVVSSAMGVALAVASPLPSDANAAAPSSRGARRVTAVVGDLTFLHDLTAWVRGPESALAVTVVVVDNGGGGIFSFLPQAAGVDPAVFDRLFVTPQVVDVSRVAAGLGVEVVEVSSTARLAEVLSASCSGPRVLHVRVPGGGQNVSIHDEVHHAVAKALRQVLDLETP